MEHLKENVRPYCFFNKSNLNAALENEWLISNAHGSYASSTVSGILTRKYHGLFVLAEQPPLNRNLFITKIEETLEKDGLEYLLYSNCWNDAATIIPNGNIYLDVFYLDENMPVWIYKCSDILIEKRIILHYNKNILAIKYSILNSDDASINLSCNLFGNNRNFHSLQKNNKIDLDITQTEDIIVLSNSIKQNFIKIRANFNSIELKNITYYNYFLKEENNRGFEALENHLLLGKLSFKLAKNNSAEILIACSNENIDTVSFESITNEIKLYNNIVVDLWKKEVKNSPDWVNQLILSSTFFIIKKYNVQKEYLYSILAGYHWFGDWGRDTMISLPGICLVTGRFNIAASILTNYSYYLNDGLLPNRFPDDSEIPDYNTVDASLWYFNAVFQYYKFTNNITLIEELYPVLKDIILWHIKGTKYNIKIDPADGLIYAGQEGSQLTWMDAKIGDYVVTPRIGKPIEINALWYNALCIIRQFSSILNKHDESFFSEYIKLTEDGFQKYWDEKLQYCSDVLTLDDQPDNSLRPNQILALSLEYSPLTIYQKRCILDNCGRLLLNYFGMKSLAKGSKNYYGKYLGNPFERDSAYHQGTVWGWLLGHYAIAYYKVTKNKSVAYGFLETMEKHINEAGIGFISEIFDADYPHAPRGCIAQAWSVGEFLFAWHYLSKY
ncbi:amylo-alpha-1,6-glucosidase [Pigmentibacter sp. JX0631]|uniref:amylo-alpha-1,6-glucosidase n=1 Tax=Pigmentibacter sp. JX0631 TaxID=2976982 RepID=UPI0024695809|nr:amylo-alpha-1,6-glucosidase [Pigmentibacter sp. JX0631]WGL59830.1 amylo-alpha-1,6-glucosidase [Pigmentibacter sp. JX0631]